MKRLRRICAGRLPSPNSATMRLTSPFNHLARFPRTDEARSIRPDFVKLPQSIAAANAPATVLLDAIKKRADAPTRPVVRERTCAQRRSALATLRVGIELHRGNPGEGE